MNYWDYSNCFDLLFNIFTFSIEGLPNHRLVCQNWKILIDESRSLQQQLASKVLNNRTRVKILSQNLSIYPKLHLLLDGLPIDYVTLDEVIHCDKFYLIKEYLAKKSYIRICPSEFKKKHLIDEFPFLDTSLLNNATLKQFHDLLSLLDQFYQEFDVTQYCNEHVFIWQMMCESSLLNKHFEDWFQKCMIIFSNETWSNKCDEIMTLIFCRSPESFKRCVDEKVETPSTFIKFLLNSFNSLNNDDLLSPETLNLDDNFNNCIDVLIENRMNDLLIKLFDLLNGMQWFHESFDFLKKSILFGCNQAVCQYFWQAKNKEQIENVGFLVKKSPYNFDIFLKNKFMFQPGAFNTILLILGDISLIDEHLDSSCSTVVSEHLYQVYSDFQNDEFIIKEEICEYVFDKYHSILSDIEHFKQFHELLSNPNHEWYHKRGRITQLMMLRSYEDLYDNFITNEIDLAEFFYGVVGKQLESRMIGHFSLPYFVVHYHDLIKRLNNPSRCWDSLYFLFSKFATDSVQILNQLEKMGIPFDEKANVWADLNSCEAIEWFLQKGFPIKTKRQLESFLLEIITADAYHLMPIFEKHYIEFKQLSDKKLTITPSLLNESLNFDIFSKLCQLGVINTPKTLEYSFLLGSNDEETSDSNDEEEETDQVTLYLTDEQLATLHQ